SIRSLGKRNGPRRSRPVANDRVPRSIGPTAERPEPVREILAEPMTFLRRWEIWPVVKLRVRAGESIQEAVRRFRKLCERSGLRKEMRRKAYYEKPSERRRREELKRLRKARQHQVSRV